MIRETDKKLVLETGQEFYGHGHGADRNVVCPIVFNTSVVGYQEILSDPSYTGQIIVMTYPPVGQYGITDDDYQTKTSFAGGLVLRECCYSPSNFRYTKTLPEELEEHNIPCISGVDTRELTRAIRSAGRSLRAAIVSSSMPREEALSLIAATAQENDSVRKVTCRKRWFSRTPNHRLDIVAIDCGIKNGLIKSFNQRGCNVTVVPAFMPAEEMMGFQPDGIIVAGGPGSPNDVPEIVETLSSLKGRLPILGIGLGAQLLALSYGASCKRLKVGVHGTHPVLDIDANRIGMCTLCQDWAVDEASIDGGRIRITHKDVMDGTVEGFECAEDKVMGIQFNPEGAPGPHDMDDVLDKFTEMMED